MLDGCYCAFVMTIPPPDRSGEVATDLEEGEDGEQERFFRKISVRLYLLLSALFFQRTNNKNAMLKSDRRKRSILRK